MKSYRLNYLLFFLFILLVTNCGKAGENLIINGDFESVNGNLPDKWDTDVYGDDSGVRFYVEDEGAYSGNHYVSIENIRPNDSKLVQRVKVKPETIYKLSCRIKAKSAAKDAVGANISVLHTWAFSKDFKDTKGRWEYVEFYGITGKDQHHIVVAVRLGGYGNLNKGKASFDAFKLEQVSNEAVSAKIINLYEDDIGQALTDAKQKMDYLISPQFLTNTFVSVFLFLGIFLAIYHFLFKQQKLKQLENKWVVFSFFFFLLVGFLLRLFIAPIIEGYPNDISCFKAWSNMAADIGLLNFYSADLFVDYPPGYIYILYIIGFIRNIFSLGYDSDVYLILLKAPAILADIICTGIIFQISRKKLNYVAASALSLLYLFNPAVIFNSSAYGQIDSFFMLFVIIMLIFAYKERLEIASAFFIIALLIKPQALIFVPIGLYAFIQNKSLKAVGISLLYMALTFAIIIFPFSIKQNFFWIFRLYWETLCSYQFATLNAFNLFAFLGGNGTNENEILFIFSYKIWGLIFTLALVGYSAFLYFKSKDKSKVFLVAMFTVVTFFMLSSKMHERYLFPVIALVIISYIYTKDKRILFLLAGFSTTVFLNQALLIGMVLTSKLFWFPPDYLLMRTMSLINIGLFIYTVYLCFDISIKGHICPFKLHPAKDSEKQYSFMEDELREGLSHTEARQISLSQKDYIIIGVLTFIYFIVALFNLGSLKAPQSFWKPANSGESFYVDLGESKDISRVNYFMGLGEGSYKLEFSEDGEIWYHEKVIQQKTRFGAIGLKYIDFNLNARYVKISCEEPGVMLNEIALFSQQSTKPVPIVSILELSSPANIPLHGKAENVFDEQDTVSHYPGFMNSMYFDEIYHARTAYEHLHHLEPSETSHPPLGKVIISAGIAIFGMTPFGWRITGTVVGIAMVPLMYLFGFRLFKKTEYAFIAAFLFAFDFMHFSLTRIATIDVYVVFFIILMYYFMYKYFNMSFFETDFKKTLIPLLLSGIFFGLAVSCKWIGLYGGIGLAIIFFASLTSRFYEYIKAKKQLTYKRNETRLKKHKRQELITRVFYRYAILTLLWCVLVFVLVPVTIYLLSYIPFMMVPGPGHELVDVFRYQKHMYNYHSHLQASHAFSSAWWEWPIIRRPLWLYKGAEMVPDKVSSIVLMGNPAIWWFGIFSIIAAFIAAWAKRKKEIFVVLIAAASQYLPWVLVPRKLLFIYHFFATIPFMILCTTFVLMSLREKFPKFKYAIYIYLLIVLILFIMFYPVLSGAVVSKSYVTNYLRWFDSWVF